jgi:hypothetical protein
LAPTSRNRLSREYTHRAFRADDNPPLIDQRLIQPAAEHLHRQQTARRDPAHHAAELVHVRVDHDAWALDALGRDDRAHAVEGDRGGIRLHLIDHHLADRFLEAGRPWRVGELAQQLDGAILCRERRGGESEQ